MDLRQHKNLNPQKLEVTRLEHLRIHAEAILREPLFHTDALNRGHILVEATRFPYSNGEVRWTDYFVLVDADTKAIVGIAHPYVDHSGFSHWLECRIVGDQF